MTGMVCLCQMLAMMSWMRCGYVSLSDSESLPDAETCEPCASVLDGDGDELVAQNDEMSLEVEQPVSTSNVRLRVCI